MEIKAYVDEIRANAMGDRANKIRISASYESANIISSITFDVPVDKAKIYYIGQTLSIKVEPL